MKQNKIQEFKSILEQQRNDLVHLIESLDKDKNREAKGPITQDIDDQSKILEDVEMIDSLEVIERSKLVKIDKALNKISSNNFGICEECGDEISEKRLWAATWSSKCINCA